MSVVKFDPGQSAFSTNHAYSLFIDCLKRAVEVIVEYSEYVNGNVTEIAIRDSSGQVLDNCVVEIDGNPYGLNPGQPRSYTPGPGGTSAAIALPGDGPAEAPGDITSFRFGVSDRSGGFQAHFKARGLDPISPADFLSILTDTTGGYERLVGLLDDDTEVIGSAQHDRIEVGEGSDLVRAKGGDDTVFKWQPGDLRFFGGLGRDTLDLSPDGNAVVQPYSQAMILDLGTGLGQTAYGDSLFLKSVEVIRTGASDDRITGSADADEIHDTFGGADVFRTKAGDDIVTLFSNYQNTIYNGGAGTDSLVITTSGFGGWTPATGFGVQRLHLGDSSKNLEDFEGLRLRNVENVQVNMVQDFINMTLIGAAADEVLTVNNFFARNGLVTIKGKNGNDDITGGYGTDRLVGGKGRDSLTGRDGDDRLFGDAHADTLNGGLGDDRLTGGKGPDTFEFAAGFGHDTVTDFVDGQDVLDFSGHSGVGRFKDLTITATAKGARVDDGDGGFVELIGVDAADLDRGDFVF